MSTMSHVRRLTCARVSPQPSDLIQWVTKQGGFVNPAVTLTTNFQQRYGGLGLVATKDIPKGSDLIALPRHLPLRFGSGRLDGPDLAHPVLVELASHIPGGVVNPAVTLTTNHQQPYGGLGLVASKDIPKGSDLIALPRHLPLRFGSGHSDSGHPLLVELASHIPVASKDIPKGSDLIALPATSHLPLKFGPGRSNGGESAHPGLVELASHIPEELWALRLGLKLLLERAKSGSFWWPYISNLPETYSVPIFFPGDDIKNLHYAPVLYQVNKRCRFLLEFEKLVKNALSTLKSEDHPFGGQVIDASSLGWAMTAVSSRAFRLYGEELPDGGITNVPMMLPLIDMCNHSFTPNAKIIQEKGTGTEKMLVKVIAEAHIKQDEALALNYGSLNNDLLLLDYGFVVPSNPYETIELKYDGVFLDAASMAAGVSSPNFSSPSSWQQQILTQLNLSGDAPDLKVSIGGPDLVEGRLLAALRVLLATDENTVQKHDLKNLMSLSTEAPLGMPNEINALRTIVALCVIALGHFPTKIMEDESILKQEISDSTRLAVEFRMQKKCMIVDVMRDLTRRVKNLSSKESSNAQS